MRYLFKHFAILLTCFVFLIFASGTYAANATLSLSPASKSVSNGESFTVDVLLNTDGANTSGTDMYLTFDKDKLDLLDITNGSIYDQYVGKSINNDTGSASLSGLASSATTLFTGSGKFATLRFRASANGTAAVSFNFTPGNKNDSNIADFDTQSDALTSVTNGSYTISGSSSGSGSSSSGSNGSTTTSNTSSSNPSTLPVTADMMPVFLLIGINLLLVTSAFVFMKYFRH